MATDVARARRFETPAWVNGRTILGLVLFAVAFLAGQRLLAAADETVGVWAASRDLPLGETLDAADLEQVQVRMPEELLSRYATSVERVDGGALLHPLRAGELVSLDWVGTGSVARAGRSLTIPVSPEHAVGGQLRIGDRVDVFATFDAGDARARTVLIVRGAQVVGTVDAGGLITGEEATIGVTIATTQPEAARLSFALRTGEIDLARVEAPAPPGRIDSVDSESFR